MCFRVGRDFGKATQLHPRPLSLQTATFVNTRLQRAVLVLTESDLRRTPRLEGLKRDFITVQRIAGVGDNTRHPMASNVLTKHHEKIKSGSGFRS